MSENNPAPMPLAESDVISSNPDTAAIEIKPTRPQRDQERYMEISGPDRSGHTKGRLFMRHYLQYSDGTTKEIEELEMVKPIINIFSAGGYVNLFLEFKSRTDVDLAKAFACIQRYFDTSNGVTFTEDEMTQGFYTNEVGEDEQVFTPVLEISISPLGHEFEYMIHGFRPLLYAMVGREPENDLNILELVFKDKLFLIDDNIGTIDHQAIRLDLMDDILFEDLESFDPDDYQD